MGVPHKHAELIKAWADGAEIQWLNHDGRWLFVNYPGWGTNEKYRINPASKTDAEVIS